MGRFLCLVIKDLSPSGIYFLFIGSQFFGDDIFSELDWMDLSHATFAS
jgi:hypothetical protein